MYILNFNTNFELYQTFKGKVAKILIHYHLTTQKSSYIIITAIIPFVKNYPIKAIIINQQ